MLGLQVVKSHYDDRAGAESLSELSSEVIPQSTIDLSLTNQNDCQIHTDLETNQAFSAFQRADRILHRTHLHIVGAETA